MNYGGEDHWNGRLGQCMTVWLQVREYSFDCGLGWTPTLSDRDGICGFRRYISAGPILFSVYAAVASVSHLCSFIAVISWRMKTFGDGGQRESAAWLWSRVGQLTRPSRGGGGGRLIYQWKRQATSRGVAKTTTQTVHWARLASSSVLSCHRRMSANMRRHRMSVKRASAAQMTTSGALDVNYYNVSSRRNAIVQNDRQLSRLSSVSEISVNGN